MAFAVIQRYGHMFEDTDSDLMIELKCYRFNLTKREDGYGPAYHMEKAIKQVFPETVFRWHEWTYKRLEDWCYHDKIFWIGCGASGKSTDAAMFVYMDFLAAPECTTTNLYSTTKDMLRQRIWKEIVRFYNHWHPEGIEYRKSLPCITLGSDDTINGIFGNAIFRDDGSLAVNNLVGRHNDRNRCIADELQATPDAVIKSTANSRLGGSSFKLLGMGNPESREDCLGRQAEPVGGWGSVTEDTGFWKTRNGGWARHFDGLKSPAITAENGEKLFRFLLGAKDVTSIVDDFGEQSIEYWSQVRGFLKAEGFMDRFLDYATIDKFKMRERVKFASPPKIVCGADPAFSSGGDRFMLQFFKVGISTTGDRIVELWDSVHIKLSIEGDEPLNYFAARRVKEECISRGVQPRNFAIDCTGAQNALADIIEREWGAGIYRVNFNGTASDNPVSSQDYSRPAKQAYVNRVTELWHMFSVFANYGMIKGLFDTAVKEFTSRKALYKNKRRQAEPKKEMKSRVGYSPDVADAIVTGLALIKERLGIYPMGRSSSSSANPAWREWQKKVQSHDLEESYADGH